MDDTNIIKLYFARNQDAITETDRSYGRRLHGLSQRIVQNYEDAQECVSDTYLKTWETIPPKQPEHFFAYLAKLCRYFSLGRLDWKNAAKRKAEVVALTQEMEQCIPDTSRDAILERKEIIRLLNTFLTELSEENRLLFLRRYWYCETVGEIAQRYGYRENAVYTRLHRIRAQLNAYLAKEGIYV